jgi:hypothetical protein
MHTEVFKRTALFIIGINVLIIVACQRRSQVYLKRPYTCTRLHGFKYCKCVTLQSSIGRLNSYTYVLASNWLTCFVFCDGRCNRYCLMSRSREAKRCVDGRRGEEWGKRQCANWTNTGLCSIIFVLSLLYRSPLLCAVGDTYSWRTDCYGTLVRMNPLR